MEADDRLLTQILMDFSLFEHTREKTLPVMPGDNPALRASQQQAEVLSQPTDLLTQGCWKLLNDGEISVWLVFGHQILLDIHAILGTKISGGWRKLQQQVSEHSSIIDYKMDIKAGRLRFPAERWPSGGGGELAGEFCQRLEITKSSETSGFQARKDAMLRFTNWQNVGGPSHEVISSLQGFGATLTNIQRSTQAMAELILTEPSREVNFIFAHDPIYCGFEAFRFAVDFETLGLALAKHHPGIFLVGHIYNACHQSDLLSIHWAELDEVIEQHIMVLFAGELPKTMKQCLKRAYVQIGVSATEFAKDKRNKSGKQKLRHWGPEMMPTKASAIFRRHFSQEVSMQQCLYQLDLLSQSTLTSPGKQVRQKQVTPLQLLSHIQDYLPTTFKAMEINYINLVKRCNNILLNIRNSIKDEMKINHPLVSPQDGGTETGFVRMVSEILQEADGIQDCQEEFFRRDMRGPMGPIRGGPQLRIAGNVLFEDVLTEALGKLETGA